MSVGIVLLVHTALDRAEQAARHWAAGGCPVVIHVDKSVDRSVYAAFTDALADVPEIRFCQRFRCEWGTWGLVAASQAASESLLNNFGDVKHVYLASGACLPLRPVQELVDYLAERPETDFIESATTSDVPWTMGGLEHERFTLRFPFSWKRQRYLFDKCVDLQRKLRLKRKVPEGVMPHMGSQWWCLTRDTISAILNDPRRAEFDAYFKHVWIPDEAYFQTLARRHSNKIESRSLTLSKFDYQGKPHVFYDDHLQLLRRSDCFVARKIWPDANRLYDAFLSDDPSKMKQTEPNPGKIDRIFAKAVDRRTRGRPGLYMQSRFPREDWENGATAAPYSIFEGFSEIFVDFENWLTRTTGCRVHGHLFGPERVEFAEGQSFQAGALADSAKLRDANPRAFLTNLIWNTRGERQCFQFGPKDNQKISWLVAKDPNAQISLISGAWAMNLFRSGLPFSEVRKQAARLQKIESDHIGVLRSPYTRARVRIWTMAEFVEAPMEPLQTIIDEIGRSRPHRLSEVPQVTNLEGFGEFLQNLKNEGMHPHLMGDFTVARRTEKPVDTAPKPYLVR